MEQKDFSSVLLSKHLSNFIANPEMLMKMSKKVKKQAITDAAKRLADVVEKFVK